VSVIDMFCFHVSKCSLEQNVSNILGRAITQTVSRRLPTAAAPVRAQVKLGGICGGQSGTGVGFSPST
jgi:hypothetical protein